jgi:hypothetical protein
MCVLIAAAFVASLSFSLCYAWCSQTEGIAAELQAGFVHLMTTTDIRSGFRAPGMSVLVARRAPLPDMLWPPGLYRHTLSAVVSMPLWLPFLALLLPTLFLWYVDRRCPPGHCRCGYNLTGLTSGRCPECGTSVVAPRSHAAT